MNVLSPLSFDEFLRTPRSAGGSDLSGYTFSIVPPTPQDMLLIRPMISPNYHEASGNYPSWITSSPLTSESGILAPKDILGSKDTQRYTREHHSRSSSAGSLNAHRTSPYSHSRQSSGASSSSLVAGEARYCNTASEGESHLTAINPAYLGGINPTVLGSQSRRVSVSSFSDAGTELSWQSFPNIADSEDELSHGEECKPITIPTRTTARETIDLLDNPVMVSRAPICSMSSRRTSKEHTSSQTTAPVSSTKPKPRRQLREIEAPPLVKLVTAITASGKKSHARKRPEDHIPRPRNAFILFRKHVVDSKLIPPEVEIRHQNISVVVSKMWAEADPETKFRFQEQARVEKEAHMRNYPDYKYQPVYRRTNVVRRKMKPDPVEDKKCTVLASLLMEGKEGVELEAAAAQEVHAVNKKRLRVQKALAAREARNISTPRRTFDGGRNRQTSADTTRSTASSSKTPLSDSDESEAAVATKSYQSTPLAVEGMFPQDVNAFQSGSFPNYTHGHGTVQHFNLDALSSHAQDRHQQLGLYDSFGPMPFACSDVLTTDFSGASIAQPADFVLAMYDNNIQPMMEFTAGPPGAIPQESALDSLASFDFDMSHYEEALAGIADYSGGEFWP